MGYETNGAGNWQTELNILLSITIYVTAVFPSDLQYVTAAFSPNTQIKRVIHKYESAVVSTEYTTNCVICNM